MDRQHGWQYLRGPPWLQALDNLMPGFDREIAKLAQRVLINPRSIDYHTGVLATKVTPGATLWGGHSCLVLPPLIEVITG